APVGLNSLFGSRVTFASPGDYNNDGHADLAVAVYRVGTWTSGEMFGAAPDMDSHGVYLVFGSATGWGAEIDLTADADVHINGFAGNLLAIDNAGDFNADGVQDLVIGDPYAAGGRGSVSILHGQASRWLRQFDHA